MKSSGDGEVMAAQQHWCPGWPWIVQVKRVKMAVLYYGYLTTIKKKKQIYTHKSKMKWQWWLDNSVNKTLKTTEFYTLEGCISWNVHYIAINPWFTEIKHAICFLLGPWGLKVEIRDGSAYFIFKSGFTHRSRFWTSHHASRTSWKRRGVLRVPANISTVRYIV